MNQVKYRIYGLIDPRDRLIHYIGKTVDEEQRLKHHLYGVETNPVLPKNLWLRDLLQAGDTPQIVILDICDETTLRETEKFWITRCLSPQLTNVVHGNKSRKRFVFTRRRKQPLIQKNLIPIKPRATIEVDTNKLLELRKINHLKQFHVEKNIGLRRAHLSLIERGRIEAPILSIVKLAREYKIDPRELLLPNGPAQLKELREQIRSILN